MVAVLHTFGLAIVRAAKRGPAFKLSNWEVVIEMSCPVLTAAACTIVMVSSAKKIRQMAVQLFHCLSRVLPFARRIAIGDISQVQHASDVALGFIFDNPTGLL